MTPGLMDEEEFRTFCVKAEGIVNSRPLTYVSADPADLNPLTPNHFLIPMTARELAPIPTKEDLSITKKWQQIHKTLDQFWGRFLDEYVPTLKPGSKPGSDKEERQLEIGDVVALLEKNERGRWPLGIITDTYPNEADDQVRKVDVEICRRQDDGTVEKTVYTRNVRKLMFLEKPWTLPEDGEYAKLPKLKRVSLVLKDRNLSMEKDKQERPVKPEPVRRVTRSQTKAAQSYFWATGPRF